MHELDFRYEISRNFKCSNCGSTSATTELLSLMGEAKKRLSKFDVFDMIMTLCKSCGQMELFDKYFLPEVNIWSHKKKGPSG